MTIKRLLSDPAQPSRVSRTVATTVGGISAGTIATAVLVVGKWVDAAWVERVTLGDLTLVVGVVLVLVAQLFARLGQAKTETIVKQAMAEKAGEERSRGLGGIGAIIAAAMLLPAVAGAQYPLGQGVGFPTGESWSVGFRGCGIHSSTDPDRNPWIVTGLDVALNCCPAAWTTAQRESYRRAYCEWMGDTYIPPEQRDGSASCECVFGGPIGGYPHGVGRYEDLVRYGELYGTGGLPSAVEMDLLYRSDAAVLWLWQQLCLAGELQACLRLESRQQQGESCGNGWRCTLLVDLPAEERPPLAAVTNYTGSAPSDACSWHNGRAPGSGSKTWIRNRPSCFVGLPSDCQTVSTLRAECWDPPAPTCGDGTCDPAEACDTCPADCGPCEPPTGGLVITITPIETGWQVEWEVDGETGTSTTAAPGTVRILPGDVTLSLPAVPAGECPERAVLEAVRGEVCE